ncbi:hypothetical protein L218DRAFT_949615 [Marasmius fiardii PR-910]|nr:hypothetical protein L218DRAFT_949615 [Marasmius fiardii PR-910]
MSREDSALSSGNSHLHLPFNFNGTRRFLVSSTFGLEGATTGGSSGGGHIPVDMTLLSNDSVVFYTHERTLLQASNNSFRNLLPLQTGTEYEERVVFLPDIASPELEIMLLAVHNVPASRNGSMGIQVQPVMRGIDFLSEYGITPSTCITPASHLYQHMLFLAPFHSLEIFAIAAQYGLVSLAVTVSSHTLMHDLSQLSDDLLRRAGAIYVLRLHQLHMERLQTLKMLLTAELGLHNPTPECDFVSQKRLKEMWTIAVANLLFLTKPDTTTTLIKEKITEYTSALTCPDCLRLRDNQLNKVISEWSVTRVRDRNGRSSARMGVIRQRDTTLVVIYIV